MQEHQMMTPLPFRLDEQLLIKSARLNASRYNAHIFWFAVIVAVMLAGVIVYTDRNWTPGRLVLNSAAPLAVAAILTVGLRLIMFPIHARRNLRQQKALSEDMTLSWTDKDFRYSSGKSYTEMPFADLYGYRASPDLILLYRSNQLFHVVPVSAFGDTALTEAFIHRLDENGVQRR